MHAIAADLVRSGVVPDERAEHLAHRSGIAAHGRDGGLDVAGCIKVLEAGRRGPRGTLTVGDPHNEEAARHLANEVACMANTPGGGAIVVGVEGRSGRLHGG